MLACHQRPPSLALRAAPCWRRGCRRPGRFPPVGGLMGADEAPRVSYFAAFSVTNASPRLWQPWAVPQIEFLAAALGQVRAAECNRDEWSENTVPRISQAP